MPTESGWSVPCGDKLLRLLEAQRGFFACGLTDGGLEHGEVVDLLVIVVVVQVLHHPVEKRGEFLGAGLHRLELVQFFLDSLTVVIYFNKICVDCVVMRKEGCVPGAPSYRARRVHDPCLRGASPSVGTLQSPRLRRDERPPSATGEPSVRMHQRLPVGRLAGIGRDTRTSV